MRFGADRLRHREHEISAARIADRTGSTFDIGFIRRVDEFINGGFR